MIKSLLTLAAALICWRSVLCQDRREQDSLIRDVKRMYAMVDSLRKKATDQFKVNQSLSTMVDRLSHRKDSATNGLPGWRKSFDRQSAQFDSTLDRLDSCSGLLNRLSDSLMHLPNIKN